MTTLMLIFLIAVLGYALGSIKIAGLQLGTAGILLVALVFGHFGYEIPQLIRDLGLAIFVTAVGFIAGPVFFRNFKRKAMHYIFLGFLIILVGAGVTVAAILLFQVPTPLAVGLMSGALTSTPGLAAAIEASGDAMASVGYGIAYPFGVVGVVLFVQLMPKVAGVDAAKEAQRLEADLILDAEKPQDASSYFQLDDYGFFPFTLAVVLGILIGKIVVPLPGGATFHLGTSGGPLLTGLLFGHFAHIGPISIISPAETAKPMREFGLILFLMGAGTNAGQGFLAVLREYGIMLFVVGIFMTICPMVAGYYVSRRIMRLDLLNTLGSICGGMTSTPALGSLISVAKSDIVAASYAATYPVALIFVVLTCQFITILFR